MGFAVVVPGDDLDEFGTRRQDIFPSCIPEKVRREDEVLAVSYLRSIVPITPRISMAALGPASVSKAVDHGDPLAVENSSRDSAGVANRIFGLLLTC